jgi:hypothetical protein
VERTVTVPVWLLLLTAVCLAVLGVALAWPRDPAPAPGIDPVKVYEVCRQYASLDLSGMVGICRDAGYQG